MLQVSLKIYFILCYWKLLIPCSVEVTTTAKPKSQSDADNMEGGEWKIIFHKKDEEADDANESKSDNAGPAKKKGTSSRKGDSDNKSGEYTSISKLSSKKKETKTDESDAEKKESSTLEKSKPDDVQNKAHKRGSGRSIMGGKVITRPDTEENSGKTESSTTKSTKISSAGSTQSSASKQVQTASNETDFKLQNSASAAGGGFKSSAMNTNSKQFETSAHEDDHLEAQQYVKLKAPKKGTRVKYTVVSEYTLTGEDTPETAGKKGV